MKKFNLSFIFTICLAALTTVGAVTVIGQDVRTAVPTPTPEAAQNPQRPELLRQLGLTQDQVVKIRRLNSSRKPQLDAAQDRLKRAMMLLDQAIYADVLDEADVIAKVKEAQQAQGEVQRLRFFNELAVRKILSPDQLVRFRQLREGFASDRRRANQNRGSDKPPENMRPMNRPRQLVRPASKTP